jgi:hypothetical protein
MGERKAPRRARDLLEASHGHRVAHCLEHHVHGEITGLVVETGAGFDHVSVAAMLIPTND